MSACPMCGSGGTPERQELKDFVLLVCAECGAGLGMERKSAPQAAEAAPLASRPTPATGAYELSPTGQHSVVTHNMVKTGQPNPPSDQTPSKETDVEPTSTGTVYVVSASDSVASATKEAGSGSKAFAEMVMFSTGVKLVETLVGALRSGEGPALIAVFGDVSDLSASQLAFAIRSIETGLDDKKTPLLVLCDDDSGWDDRCKGLGNARAVQMPGGLSDEETGARVVALVERLSTRA